MTASESGTDVSMQPDGSHATPIPDGPGARMPTWRLLPRLLFVGSYAILLLWFHCVDVYHRHFSASGPLLAFDNALRVVFIFYVFWIVQAVGAAILRLTARREFERLSLLEQLALGFFAGAGTWHCALLVLGYLDLYSFTAAVIVTVPVVTMAYGDFAATARATVVGLSAGSALRRSLGCGDNSVLTWLVIVVAVAAFALLLVVKGLYPGGGHDYFTHYFYYYQTVIDRGGVWPNDVWYHYYYSKGAGLIFLAMLLTDPLAPQLVTFCFIAAAALVILLLCRQAAPGTRWPLVGAALFLAAYIYTPTWGQFEKPHEINATFIVAILWTAAAALDRPLFREALPWTIAAVLSIVGILIFDDTAGLYLGAVFGLLMLCYLAMRRRREFLICFGLACVTGATLVTILSVNYLTTGLPNDQTILMFWPFAGVEKLHQLGYLHEVLKLYWGRLGMVEESVPLPKLFHFLIYCLRLDLFWPLVAGRAAVAVTTLAQRRRLSHVRSNAHSQAAVLAAMLAIFFVVALVAGRAQPSSFFRYASFAMPLVIVGSIIAGSLPDLPTAGLIGRLARDRRSPVIMLGLTLIAIGIAASQRAQFIDSVLPRAAQFAVGDMSIDRAYTLQTGWPDKPWGAIYPGARGASGVVGPHTPIWSMHVISYCMLPDCRIESTESFTIGRGWDALMFGTPEDGRRVLQDAGINYFLFSRELPLVDQLPLSPLFRPDNIAHYLGVRWNDANTVLLTWLGPNTKPLDAAWIAAYRHAVEQSPYVQSFPYDDMRSIYSRLNQTPHPWHSFALPWGRRTTR